MESAPQRSHPPQHGWSQTLRRNHRADHHRPENIARRHRPALRHTLALLKAGKPVKVLAMPPYDTLIAPAIQQLYPKAVVNVTQWPTEGQTLAQLEEYAKKVRTMAQDLVLIAVPGSLPVQKPEAFHKSYSWIMNWSLSFGPQQWDVIVALPSAAKTKLSTEEQQHEALARRLIDAQDLHMLAGDASALTTLLTQHINPKTDSL
jgi:hypothetical protein